MKGPYGPGETAYALSRDALEKRVKKLEEKLRQEKPKKQKTGSTNKYGWPNA